MAEALALIGLTSSIITFIDFGSSLLSNAKSARDAWHGAVPEIHELDLMLRDISERQSRLADSVSPGKKLLDCNRVTKEMAKECAAVAEKLRALIIMLTMRNNRMSRILESGRVALLSISKGQEIKELRTRLAHLDSAVRRNLEETLQSDRHSVIVRELKAISHSHLEAGIKYDLKLEEIKTSILELTIQNKEDMTDQAAQLTSLGTKLASLEKEIETCHRQASVVQSLYFPEIKRRWSQIPESEMMTNNWLFDSSQTSFSSWLESDGGIYHVSGLPGSGKSTLMKHAFGHQDTVRALKKWAEPADLCMASFYFWNQGFEMQKSQLGLLQSLLYQILKHLPTLIPQVLAGRPSHEAWDFDELKTVFGCIVSLSSLTTRFCFFIDGLDEFNGEEEDIAKILLSIASSPNIKICASSRPRSIFDEMLWSTQFMLQMQDFTKPDMQVYVRRRLRENSRFRELEEASEAGIRGLMNQVADQARGVWLWVYLVTRDLVYAANRHESFEKLQEIVNGFPKDLEAYFTQIISRVRPTFRDEMARIFLITLQEVQPLPLFAFSLLEKEVSDPEYAVRAETLPLDNQMASETDKIWTIRLQNRCSDLLVVNEGYHPIFLLHPVDFLHRTVRDFLKDCYYQQLVSELVIPFNPPISLCRMMLFLLKKQPSGDFRRVVARNRLISLVDELLYYAREAEKLEIKGDGTETKAHVEDLLDEVDRVNTICTRGFMKKHWTHIRDSPRTRGLDEYREGGNCNWLALTVQARLVGYVRAKLEADPRQIRKPGRPLLDYALRPRRVMPLKMPYHSQRDEANIDLDMVLLLLEKGASPNQPVHLNDSRSVWELFLISCWESVSRGEASDASRRAWYAASDQLLDCGARGDHFQFSSDDAESLPPVKTVMHAVFGREAGEKLVAKMEAQAAQDRQRAEGTWTGWLRRLI
ncbi:hypothetical protein BKA56DRAFT_503443 [Ilyonectria sp. MPI-CAGE-AT-0026]|nr:hypothetical protein BKA56DRAFT_503443 [Ilyonectria sp. MPI-CAGE-AT-0026]